jgi:hypothetical protein
LSLLVQATYLLVPGSLHFGEAALAAAVIAAVIIIARSTTAPIALIIPVSSNVVAFCCHAVGAEIPQK